MRTLFFSSIHRRPWARRLPKLQESVPLRSFRRIDCRRPGKAVRAVAEILEAAPWEKALPHIAAARQHLLWRYNLIPALARLAPALEAADRGEISTDALARIFIGRDIPVDPDNP